MCRSVDRLVSVLWRFEVLSMVVVEVSLAAASSCGATTARVGRGRCRMETCWILLLCRRLFFSSFFLTTHYNVTLTCLLCNGCIWFLIKADSYLSLILLLEKEFVSFWFVYESITGFPNNVIFLCFKWLDFGIFVHVFDQTSASLLQGAINNSSWWWSKH